MCLGRGLCPARRAAPPRAAAESQQLPRTTARDRHAQRLCRGQPPPGRVGRGPVRQSGRPP
eukprot:4520809-Alexandrium_andersonii.AAC.1